MDDDAIMTSTIQSYFRRTGYQVDVENDPYQAIERVREGNYDIMLLDFLMSPICGNQVVEEIRKFDKNIFIILLTGHKSMAPPIKTIRELDIQAYYEKSDRFDQLELLVEACVKSIRQIRTIREYEKGLSVIVDALPQIYHLQSLESMADGILREVKKLIPSEGCFLIYRRKNTIMKRMEGTVAREEAERLWETKLEGEQFEHKDGFILCRLYDEHHCQSGMLGIRTVLNPTAEQTGLLHIFIRQVSAAMANNQLHAQLNGAYMETISTLRYVVETKDAETRGHSDRVAKMAAILSGFMGMDEEFVHQIHVAGLFHDIGKIGIPDEILLKPGKLTDVEFAEVKKHPVTGAKILSGISKLKELVPIVRGHHERVDGLGYPDGLSGEDIPLGARMIALVDAFDAIVSNRKYRKGRSFDEALGEIRFYKGTQFDEKLTDEFLKLMKENPRVIRNLYQGQESAR